MFVVIRRNIGVKTSLFAIAKLQNIKVIKLFIILLICCLFLKNVSLSCVIYKKKDR